MIPHMQQPNNNSEKERSSLTDLFQKESTIHSLDINFLPSNPRIKPRNLESIKFFTSFL